MLQTVYHKGDEYYQISITQPTPKVTNFLLIYYYCYTTARFVSWLVSNNKNNYFLVAGKCFKLSVALVRQLHFILLKLVKTVPTIRNASEEKLVKLKLNSAKSCLDNRVASDVVLKKEIEKNQLFSKYSNE